MGMTLPSKPIEIGYRFFHGVSQPFFLETSDRRQHLYCIGKTGTGKSTLLRNLIVQDILAGNGIGLIDPHGDLAESILDSIPSWRVEDVVYFNPADTANPVGLNILEKSSGANEDIIPSQVTSIFRSMWPDAWGPRLEHILYATCASLVAYGGQSVLGIHRILIDSEFRGKIVGQLKDPFLRSFWEDEFANYSANFTSEAIAPVLNKVGRLIMSPVMRNIIGQPKSGFDVGYMMDHKKIFIANLSKGLLGEEKSNLLGSILATKFQLAAMARASKPEAEREDFHLYIDEFHNFLTDSFASMLGEARKYHLCLTLAHQHLAQLNERVRSAVLGNTGSIISFRVGSSDAELLAKEFDEVFPVRRFTDLSNFRVCTKLIARNEPTDPFIGWTLPDTELRFGRKNAIIRRSRERYSKPKHRVEERLERWLHPKIPMDVQRQLQMVRGDN